MSKWQELKARKKVRGIEMAPRHGLDEFPEITARVIAAIEELYDTGPIWISDESRIWDFEDADREMTGAGRGVHTIPELSRRLGVPIKNDDLIVDVVRRINECEHPQ